MDKLATNVTANLNRHAGSYKNEGKSRTKAIAYFGSDTAHHAYKHEGMPSKKYINDTIKVVELMVEAGMLKLKKTITPEITYWEFS